MVMVTMMVMMLKMMMMMGTMMVMMLMMMMMVMMVMMYIYLNHCQPVIVAAKLKFMYKNSISRRDSVVLRGKRRKIMLMRIF